MRALLTAARHALAPTCCRPIRLRGGRGSAGLRAAQRVSLTDRIEPHVGRTVGVASVRPARGEGLLGTTLIRIVLIVTLLVFPWPARPTQAVAFDYALGLHGPRQQLGNSTVVDALDNVFVVGDFYEYMDVDPGPNAVNVISAGNQDVFIAKYSPTGALLWSRSFGAGSSDIAYSIATDGANVYVTGTFAGTFNVGGTTLSSSGIFDIFIVMLTADGTYGWVRQVGGPGNDDASGIAVSVTSSIVSVYLTGHFSGTVDFDPGPGVFNLTNAGNADVFVLKLNASGSFVWARRFGADGPDYGHGIAAGAFGDAYVTGRLGGTADFDPGPGQFIIGDEGRWSVFVLKLDADGGLAWARAAGGGLFPAENAFNEGHAVALDPARSVYTTGYFSGTADFDPGPGTFSLTGADSAPDVFLWKLSEDGPTNTVPGPQTAVKDTPRVFSTVNRNQISVAGQEAGSGLGVTLTATHGTLTLAGTTGLTFTSGDGTGDMTMTFSGRAAAVNAALDGLRYTPETGYTGQAQIEVRSFLASQSGPLKPDTDSVPITVHPGPCSPRPHVQVQAAPGGGKLQVMITPTAVTGGTPNELSELQFGTFQNAKVTHNAQPIAGGQTVSLPPNTSVVTFTVERMTPGQPTTVPFTVVDRCGPWRTFVGGGTGAGF
jgi:hypothetical protein